MRAVFEAFFAWAETSLELCPAKGLLRKALKYTLNQKKSLLNYLKDPRLELSNNAAERAIKPFVLGRKNWMFCDVPRGAHDLQPDADGFGEWVEMCIRDRKQSSKPWKNPARSNPSRKIVFQDNPRFLVFLL